jgi:O-methyltransferase involved in polyketide biosynthesis
MSASDQIMDRDFSSISPSALSLIHMKGLTSIPYARQVSLLLKGNSSGEGEESDRDLLFWVRVFHFEERYKSINNLIDQTNIKNIIELSSGFSFRGLFYSLQQEMHFIDTDLPEVIVRKAELLDAMKATEPEQKGKLELQPLNVLDKGTFEEAVMRFPPGEILIINEGLLMYLSIPEKEQLCKIIRRLLKIRGGYWITADIYTSRPDGNHTTIPYSDNNFFKYHRIEENKFANIEAARDFFRENGFEVVRVSDVNFSEISSLRYLKNYATELAEFKAQNRGERRDTWMLKASKE